MNAVIKQPPDSKITSGTDRPEGLSLSSRSKQSAGSSVPDSTAEFNRDLKHAIARYDVIAARRLLRQSARFLTVNSTALIAAAARGADEIAAMLLKAGLSPRLHNDRALCTAVENGHPDMVKLLLAHKADPACRRGECLYLAAENRHLLVLSLLLDTGVYSIAEKNEALVRVVSRHKSAVPVIELLIAHGAEVGVSFLSPAYDVGCEMLDAVIREPAVREAVNTGNLDNLAAVFRFYRKKSDSHDLLGCAIDSEADHRLAVINFVVESMGQDCAFDPVTIRRSLVAALEIESDILLEKWHTIHADSDLTPSPSQALLMAVNGSVKAQPGKIVRLLAFGADPWPALLIAIKMLPCAPSAAVGVTADQTPDGSADLDRVSAVVIHLIEATLDCDNHLEEAQIALACAIAAGHDRLVQRMLVAWCSRPANEIVGPFDLIGTLRRCYSTGIS